MASIETWVAGIISLLPDHYERYETTADYEALVAIVQMVTAEGRNYVGDLEAWVASGEADQYELTEAWEQELDEEGRSWHRAYRALAHYVQRAGVPDDAVEGVRLSQLLAHAEVGLDSGGDGAGGPPG